MIPTVQADTRLAKRYLQVLDKQELPRVIRRSISRTSTSARSFLSRKLRERVNLKKAVVDASIKIRRSGGRADLVALRAGSVWFELRMSGKPIPLRDFAARETRRGVTFKIGRGKPRRVYQRGGRTAFIVRSLGGHAFVRIEDEPPGPRRARISKVYGPALPHWLYTKRLRAEVSAHGSNVWVTEIIRNSRFALMRR